MFKIQVVNQVCSDHSLIFLDIDFSKFTRGKGFWKLNNSLCKDKVYVDLIKTAIKRISCQYAIIDKDPNFFTNTSQVELYSFLEQQTPKSLQNLEMSIKGQL